MSPSVRDSTTKLENVSQYATLSGYCSCKICPAKFLKTKFPCNSQAYGITTLLFVIWGELFRHKDVGFSELLWFSSVCTICRQSGAADSVSNKGSNNAPRTALSAPFSSPNGTKKEATFAGNLLIARAVYETWTHDLFLTKEVLYHWAKTAFYSLRAMQKYTRKMNLQKKCTEFIIIF